MPHPAELEMVATTCVRKAACASLSNDGTVKIWDLMPRADDSTIRLEQPIKQMVAMPNGRSLILGGDFPARTWVLSASKISDHTLAATDVLISADGRLLAAVGTLKAGGGTSVNIWDIASDELRHVIAMPDNQWPAQVRISPDGKCLATCASEGPILIWDLSGQTLNVPEPRGLQYSDPYGAFSLYYQPLGILRIVVGSSPHVNPE